jgi:putative two-component system response regulator
MANQYDDGVEETNIDFPISPGHGEALRPVILVVDDMPENLGILFELLRPTYRVLGAISGGEALRVAAEEPQPDLILLDVVMPGMGGHELFRHLRANPLTRDIPVIFVTAMDHMEDEMRGLELGAVDYITKPLRPPVVLARIHTQIELKKARDLLRNQNAVLEAEVARRMAENDLTQLVSIRALAHLAEMRDPETGNHIHRTQRYVRTLALRLQDNRRFRDFLTDRNIDLLTRSAPLHDIGKVGIPDHILQKPGKLTPAEWEIMKTHAKLGSDAIEQAEEDAETPVDFLILAKEIAHWHHERWDGAGYPDGLAGEEVPTSARLMALADVFDALISPRIYKRPIALHDARDIIVADRGRHFDPDIVDAFLADFGEFAAIAERHRDGR